MKQLILTTMLAMVSVICFGQYCGTASVWVKNGEGKERCINVVVYNACSDNSESAVRSDLEDAINSDKKYDEEFTSRINQNVMSISSNIKMHGTASVKVINRSGSTRYLNVSVDLTYTGKTLNGEMLKSLYDEIKYAKKYDEEFYGAISYSY